MLFQPTRQHQIGLNHILAIGPINADDKRISLSVRIYNIAECCRALEGQPALGTNTVIDASRNQCFTDDLKLLQPDTNLKGRASLGNAATMRLDGLAAQLLV